MTMEKENVISSKTPCKEHGCDCPKCKEALSKKGSSEVSLNDVDKLADLHKG